MAEVARWQEIRDGLLRADLESWRADKMRTLGWSRERAEKESRLRSDHVPSAACALEAACKRIAQVEAQRDLVVQLLRRTMTDTACVGAEGPGCWFCDRDDGEHADDCEAAQALAAIEERGGARG